MNRYEGCLRLPSAMDLQRFGALLWEKRPRAGRCPKGMVALDGRKAIRVGLE
jgi:hypothetical protein